jgi:hypothetical protein
MYFWLPDRVDTMRVTRELSAAEIPSVTPPPGVTTAPVAVTAYSDGLKR